jgi:hypothetical protein
MESFNRLPELCAAVRPETGETILIKRGVPGYFEIEERASPAKIYNELRGITPEQVQAMIAGSMFGWDAPVANVEYWKPSCPDPYKHQE